jgi:hypothetical protein
MLDFERSWRAFWEAGSASAENNEIYTSRIKPKDYQIEIDRHSEIVHVKRLSGGEEVSISRNKFFTCINNINQCQGPIIPRTSIYKTVAVETTVVELLPNLAWHNQRGDIEILPEDGLSSRNTNPAGDGEPESEPTTGPLWALRLIQLRRGQFKLRQKLLHYHEGKCAITGCSIPLLLDACHIHPFADSHNCEARNGILLRSDIHDLFDAHLLTIGLDSRTVYIHLSIQDQTYRMYDGWQIACPYANGWNPVGLQLRWEQFQSI